MTPKKIILFAFVLIAGMATGYWIGAKQVPSFQINAADITQDSLGKEEVGEKEDKETKEPTNNKLPKSVDVNVSANNVEARIAIVLDDWGYNRNAIEHVLSMNEPLTLAVLPHLTYSKSIAKDAYLKGHEIILHMPMEPSRNVPLEKGTLLTTMDNFEIADLFESAIRSMPHLKGFSNHMGSKFTEYSRGMDEVIKIASTKHIYFFNSLVTASPIGRNLANTHGVPYLERDIFFDNQRDVESITKQLEKLKSEAMDKGYAIGIGHDEIITLEVLSQILPKWRKQGIKIVPLSDLLSLLDLSDDYARD